ncbi:MAG: FMN-binding protein [Ruminococcaceae bacterium]|nr:FMN-binding protein [Oscillospiraceae bacterium]MBQ2915391.1 FMN-binding protein [Clostridia bacterium]
MSNQANKSEMLPLKLMIIVTAVVLMLAIVNELTYETIAANAAAKSNSARQELFVDSTGFTFVDFELTEEEAKTVSEIYSASGAGEDILGYCMNVTCGGFGGDIVLVVGVDLDGSVTGVRLISHSETPNIGAKAVSEDSALLPQFAGASVSDIGNISAVSGATVTSEAVKDGIAKALAVAERLLKEGY